MTGTVRACLITNPRSGRGGADLSGVLPVLHAQGWEVVVRQKTHGGEATTLARNAVDQGFDLVVSCGGDGTVSEIVDGVAGTDVAVGALPGGTVNLWATELGISPNMSQAALQLVGSVRRRVDVGHVSINGRRGIHFLLMAGLGFDGAVIARVNKNLKNRIGPLAVGLATLNAIPSYKPPVVRIELDGVRWQGRVAQVVVSNTRKYGGFTSLTPDALIDDGLLDVCVIAADGAIEAGRQLASMAFRGRPSPSTAASYRVASLTVHVPDLLPLQLDGGAVRPKKKDRPDAKGVTYTFSVVAQALSVLVPRTYDGALFSREASADAALSRPDGGAQENAGKGKGVMRVIDVGADSFTAVRIRNGKVVTVVLAADTTARQHGDDPRPARELLSTLAPGSLVKVKGEKDRDRGVLQAEHITVMPVE